MNKWMAMLGWALASLLFVRVAQAAPEVVVAPRLLDQGANWVVIPINYAADTSNPAVTVQFDVQYDSSKFTPTPWEFFGSPLSTTFTIKASYPAKGIWRFVFYPTVGASTPLPSGTIITLHFQYPGGTLFPADSSKDGVFTLKNILLANAQANAVVQYPSAIGQDSDGDGMPDVWEIQVSLNPNDPTDANLDPDQDGLTNLHEYVLHTNPMRADTDGNGINDGQEDFDHDGMPNWFEMKYSLRPFDATDISEDPDNDGYSNLQEFKQNTNPRVADTILMPSGSTISGQLVKDVLLQTNGTYIVAGNVEVTPGRTFTVPSGATLQFANGATFTVNGNIVLTGTSTQPVVLTSQSNAGTRGTWQGIVIGAGSTTSAISYTKFEWADTAVEVQGGHLDINNSTITNFATNGIKMTLGATGTVVTNTIDNVNKTGTGIYLNKSSPTIQTNTIRNTDTALWITGGSAPVVNNANIITQNNLGIRVMGALDGINEPKPLVNRNTITNNTNWNYYAYGYLNGQNKVLDATSNYWGTLILQNISATIYDGNDAGANAPIVKFAPLIDVDGNPRPGTDIAPLITIINYLLE